MRRPGGFLNHEGVQCVGDGAQGWNADQFGQVVHLLLVRLVDPLPALHGVTGVGRVWNACGWVDRVVGTLLGPEGTGRLVATSVVCGVGVSSMGGLLVRHTAQLHWGLVVGVCGSSSVL